jgi:hypothetical protein
MRSADASNEQPGSTSLRRAPGVLLHRLSGPLDALLAGGVATRADDDVIDLYLVEEEAELGMASISMRVPVHCPACRANRSQSCIRCRGAGTIDELFSAWLAIRPGITDGAILEPSVLLRDMLRPVSFRMRLPVPSP